MRVLSFCAEVTSNKHDAFPGTFKETRTDFVASVAFDQHRQQFKTNKVARVTLEIIVNVKIVGQCCLVHTKKDGSNE